MLQIRNPPLDEYPQGLFLWIIINQTKFDSCNGNISYSEREGAEVDEVNLRDALKHFEIDLRVWKDLTKSELYKSLNEIYYEVDAEREKYAGLTFLCMSHGEQIDGKDFLVTKDNQYVSCEKIVDIYHNCFCFGLKNRPKFFLFNCCRGDTPNVEIQKLSVNSPIVFDDNIISFDLPYMIEGNDSVGHVEVVEDERVGFKKGDYVIVHSTIKGYVSVRHKKNGSIFVYELSKQLSSLVAQPERNFEDIVREACIATSKHDLSGVRGSQLPEFLTTLRAPCHLVIKGIKILNIIYSLAPDFFPFFIISKYSFVHYR